MRIYGQPRFLLAVLLCLTISAIPVTPESRPQLPSDANHSSPIGTPTAEDYQIWSLALKDVIEGSEAEEILIDEETVGPIGDYDLSALIDAGENSIIAHNRDWLGFKAKLSDEAISDFHKKNETVDLLDDQFSLSTHETLIGRHTLSELHEKYPRSRDFWKALRGKYPKTMGLFGVSKIGFNSDRTLAVVYVYYASGPIGGDGRYVLLRKVAGTWIFEARLMVWLS